MTDGQFIESRQEMENILSEEVMGYLGLSMDGKPYVVPLNHGYIDGKILFHSSLISKSDGKTVQASTELLPLRRTALTNILSNNGFNPVKALSGYSLKPAAQDDFHHVIIAQATG